MAFDLFVPFSAICLFIIIAIMKPDHVSEMVHIATETTGMKLVPLIAASIVCSLIISALVWAINSFLDERRQAAAWAVVTDKERKALIEFYHAAGGDNWTDNTNWCGKTGTKSVNDLSKYKSSYSWFAQGKSDLNNVRLWKGVTVNEEGRVTKLLLSKNNLRGDGEKMFAALLSECTLIEEIDFRENFIRGRLPKEVALKLPQLTGLYLSNNEFSGPIPNEFALMDHLAGIYLFNNKFSGKAETQLLFDEGNKIRAAARVEEIICYI